MNRRRTTRLQKTLHPMIKNGYLWGDYVRKVFIPALDFYTDVALSKVFPALSDEAISKEADRVEQEAFDRLGQTVAPEDYDLSYFVEPAFNEGLDFFISMRDARQGLINILAVGLFHLFEQHLCEFYLLLERDKECDPTIHQTRKRLEEEWQRKENEGGAKKERELKLDFHKAKNELKKLGFDAENFCDWGLIVELRLLANCVKHGEGNSCKKLSQCRPDLFVRPLPSNVEEEIKPGKEQFVTTPLSGQGVYFTIKEFEQEAAVLKRFWLDAARRIRQPAIEEPAL